MAKVLNLNKLRQDMKQSEGIEDSRQTKSQKKSVEQEEKHIVIKCMVMNLTETKRGAKILMRAS